MTTPATASYYDEIFAAIKSKLDDPNVIYTLRRDVEKFEALPSGIPTIDKCLSGGLPDGRLIEIFGPEASGKTTLTLHFIAAAQARGDIVYFIDAEHALDAAYAQRIGIDFDKLMFSQPDSGEQALETVRVICEATSEYQAKHNTTIKTLVVIDSIPALIPKQLFEIYEKEGFESKNALGAQARMLSSKIPMVVNRASKAGVTIILINQERDNIGVMYGPKTTQPGGRAVKFFSSLRLKVNRIGNHDRGGETVGIKTRILPVKSKQFSIFGRVAEVIIGPNGIDVTQSVLDECLSRGLIKKSGAWLTYGEHKWHGANSAIEALQADKDLLSELSNAVIDMPLNVKVEESSDSDVKDMLKQALGA